MGWIRKEDVHWCRLPYEELDSAELGDVWECDYCPKTYLVMTDAGGMCKGFVEETWAGSGPRTAPPASIPIRSTHSTDYGS